MKVIPAKVGKHDLEMKCPVCGKIWSQPNWYTDFDCPFCDAKLERSKSTGDIKE